MSRRGSDFGAANLVRVRDVNRELLEKAMRMRCVSYLADAKAQLLVHTVNTLGRSTRSNAAARIELRSRLEQTQREVLSRQAVESRLREVRAAIDDAPTLIAICGEEGTVTYANRAFANQLCSGQEPRGKRLVDVIRPADGDRHVTSLLRALGACEAWTGRLHVLTDGGSMWLRARIKPFRDGDDAEQRFILFLEDYTAEREALDSFMASHRLEAIGQLTGGIAHDFNNLLSVVYSSADMLEEELQAPSAKVRSHLSAIIGAAERAAALTKQLLAFARRQVLRAQAVDLNERITALCAMLERTIGKHHTLAFVPSEGPCLALCDPGQLETVIMNLVINARDASPPGTTITISTTYIRDESGTDAPRPALAGGDYAVVSVSDEGPGVSAELKERIFEPFFTTKPQGEHSGLGLSMTIGFAEQSGGAVDVESPAGQGAVFRLFLPTADHVAADGEAARPSTTGRALLVDDEADVRAGLRELLERLGFCVADASDVDRALELLRDSEPFDVVVSDIVLGDRRSGLDLRNEVARMYPDLPVLLISGYSLEALEDAVGQGPFLAKPFRSVELREKLAEVLGTPRR